MKYYLNCSYDGEFRLNEEIESGLFALILAPFVTMLRYERKGAANAHLVGRVVSSFSACSSYDGRLVALSLKALLHQICRCCVNVVNVADDEMYVGACSASHPLGSMDQVAARIEYIGDEYLLLDVRFDDGSTPWPSVIRYRIERPDLAKAERLLEEERYRKEIEAA